ncbi:ABC-three component system middle component 1 [Pseudomonas corrugata]
MNLTSASNDHIREVQESFPDFKFNFFTAGNSDFVSCIACWVNTSEILEQKWNAIQNILAVRYKAERKVARWNVYIAFFCRESVGRSLRLLIENDKFTARKLIFDSCIDNQNWLKEEFAIQRLNHEIFEVDLAAAKNFGIKFEYEPSSLVSSLKGYSDATPSERLEMIEKLIAERVIHEIKES